MKGLFLTEDEARKLALHNGDLNIAGRAAMRHYIWPGHIEHIEYQYSANVEHIVQWSMFPGGRP